jgi:hypothetical protein
MSAICDADEPIGTTLEIVPRLVSNCNRDKHRPTALPDAAPVAGVTATCDIRFGVATASGLFIGPWIAAIIDAVAPAAEDSSMVVSDRVDPLEFPAPADDVASISTPPATATEVEPSGGSHEDVAVARRWW